MAWMGYKHSYWSDLTSQEGRDWLDIHCCCALPIQGKYHEYTIICWWCSLKLLLCTTYTREVPWVYDNMIIMLTNHACNSSAHKSYSQLDDFPWWVVYSQFIDSVTGWTGYTGTLLLCTAYTREVPWVYHDMLMMLPSHCCCSLPIQGKYHEFATAYWSYHNMLMMLTNDCCCALPIRGKYHEYTTTCGLCSLVMLTTRRLTSHHHNSVIFHDEWCTSNSWTLRRDGLDVRCCCALSIKGKHHGYTTTCWWCSLVTAAVDCLCKGGTMSTPHHADDSH